MKKIIAILLTIMLSLVLCLVPSVALAASGESSGPVSINWVAVLAIAEAVAVAIVGFMVKYFKTSATFRGFVSQLIADAEVKYANAEKAGKIKMAWVIDQLYAIIPAPFRILFSRDDLEEFVQSVFDQITKYATIQCDKAVASLQAKYNSTRKK